MNEERKFVDVIEENFDDIAFSFEKITNGEITINEWDNLIQLSNGTCGITVQVNGKSFFLLHNSVTDRYEVWHSSIRGNKTRKESAKHLEREDVSYKNLIKFMWDSHRNIKPTSKNYRSRKIFGSYSEIEAQKNKKKKDKNKVKNYKKYNAG